MNNPVPSVFNMMAKPAGSGCNLNCTYCYYLEKDKLYQDTSPKMDDETLEEFVKQYIQSQDVHEVTFVWQGGEPTLLGVDYFERIVRLQDKYAGKKKIFNALQTNGTFIDSRWAKFLADHRFLVGISIDGPQHIHDKYRKMKNGKSAFAETMQGVEQLIRYGVDFNTLSVVNDYNQDFPLEVYHFLKQIGSKFMQFLPVVERKVSYPDKEKLKLTHHKTTEAEVTKWSCSPEGYGDFLMEIFDEWVKQDVGKYFVQLFDVTLANWVGQNAGLCVHKDYCGDAMVIERNGDVYACDHFVYPEYFRGNIHNKSLKEMYFSADQVMFGQEKKKKLAEKCLNCSVRFACHGDCPKHRFIETNASENPVSYLCEGLQKFFRHVTPAMNFMANELKNNRPPAHVMRIDF